MAVPEFGISCETCPCFEKIKGRETQPYGECRLNPPQILLAPPTIAAAGSDPKPVYAYPIVQESQHCWQYIQVTSMRNALRQMGLGSTEPEQFAPVPIPQNIQ